MGRSATLALLLLAGCGDPEISRISAQAAPEDLREFQRKCLAQPRHYIKVRGDMILCRRLR